MQQRDIEIDWCFHRGYGFRCLFQPFMQSREGLGFLRYPYKLQKIIIERILTLYSIKSRKNSQVSKYARKLTWSIMGDFRQQQSTPGGATMDFIG